MTSGVQGEGDDQFLLCVSFRVARCVTIRMRSGPVPGVPMWPWEVGWLVAEVEEMKSPDGDCLDRSGQAVVVVQLDEFDPVPGGGIVP